MSIQSQSDLEWSAADARPLLQAEGISARVISMPCVEWFLEQDASYQEGLDHYGASAAYQKIFEEFGITAERVAAAARRSLEKEGTRS